MELVTIIQNGGPLVFTAVLAFLYWAERTERKEAQEKLNEVNAQFVERLISAMNSTAQATREITSTMQTLNTTIQTVMFRLRGANGDPQ